MGPTLVQEAAEKQQKAANHRKKLPRRPSSGLKSEQGPGEMPEGATGVEDAVTAGVTPSDKSGSSVEGSQEAALAPLWREEWRQEGRR